MAAKKKTGSTRTGTKRAGGNKKTGAGTRAGGRRKTVAGKGGKGNAAARKNSAGPSGRAGSNKAGRAGTKATGAGNPLAREFAFLAVLVFCILSLMSVFHMCGLFGEVLGSFLFGMLGLLAYVFPIYLIVAFGLFVSNPNNAKVRHKVFFSIGLYWCLCGLFQWVVDDPVENVWEIYTVCGENQGGGGFFGGLLSFELARILGRGGALIVILALIIVFFMLLSGKLFFSSLYRLYEEREIRHGDDEYAGYEDNGYEDAEPVLPKRRMNTYSFKKDMGGESGSGRQQEPETPQERETQRKSEKSEKRRSKSKEQQREPEGDSVVESIPQDMSQLHIIRGGEEVLDEAVRDGESLEIPIYQEELERKFGAGSGTDMGKEKPLATEADFAWDDLGMQDGRDVSVRMETQVPLPPMESDVMHEAWGGMEEGADHAGITGDEANLVMAAGDQTESAKAMKNIDGMDGLAKIDQKNGTDPETAPVAPTAAPAAVGVSAPGVTRTVNSVSAAVGASAPGVTWTVNSASAAVGTSAAMTAVEIPYQFPSLELLSKPENGKKGMNNEELRATAQKLQGTLDSFGVRVKMGDISLGPSVTRYELMPEQGVKVSKITGLTDDIKLSLAAADIRIEAPIPGKAAVGIEVPNPRRATVALRELLESREFKKAKSKVTFAVGKDISGKTVVTDIAKMPHLLIAGATGSGKSVLINTLIMSIIYKADPNDVKLIMVDPKMVELTAYEDIPHLMIPVVKDPKKASAALAWAVAEMTQRYQKFADTGVRDIKSYNARIDKVTNKDDPEFQKMPQIVIIVDEFADLMMVAPGEVEDAVCRLAQLARAAGIHLVLATQRPSVNVITGLIKANIPSRIALSVSSQVDSRTIIDSAGAEKLLGNGDMLFAPQNLPKPIRVQGAFVSDEERDKVVNFLKSSVGGPAYNEEVTRHIDTAPAPGAKNGSDAAGDGPAQDELFADAGKFIIEKDKASIGLLQRMFRIGFNRAARIMDQLSDAGVVGPEEGTKARQILMSKEQFENYLEENG